jgi:hypothetical protein
VFEPSHRVRRDAGELGQLLLRVPPRFAQALDVRSEARDIGIGTRALAIIGGFAVASRR